MPGPILTMAATITCPHGGMATPVPSNPTVLVANSPVLVMTDVTMIAGCVFQYLRRARAVPQHPVDGARRQHHREQRPRAARHQHRPLHGRLARGPRDRDPRPVPGDGDLARRSPAAALAGRVNRPQIIWQSPPATLSPRCLTIWTARCVDCCSTSSRGSSRRIEADGFDITFDVPNRENGARLTPADAEPVPLPHPGEPRPAARPVADPALQRRHPRGAPARPPGVPLPGHGLVERGRGRAPAAHRRGARLLPQLGPARGGPRGRAGRYRVRVARDGRRARPAQGHRRHLERSSTTTSSPRSGST